MFRLLFFCIVCAVLLPEAVRGERKPKTPDVQVLEMAVKREGDLITMEGRLRNTGVRPLRALNVIFRLADGHGTTLTTQRIPVDEATLAKDAESSIEAQMKDSPYAATVLVLCETGEGVELRVGNGGPFPIQ